MWENLNVRRHSPSSSHYRQLRLIAEQETNNAIATTEIRTDSCKLAQSSKWFQSLRSWPHDYRNMKVITSLCFAEQMDIHRRRMIFSFIIIRCYIWIAVWNSSYIYFYSVYPLYFEFTDVAIFRLKCTFVLKWWHRLSSVNCSDCIFCCLIYNFNIIWWISIWQLSMIMNLWYWFNSLFRPIEDLKLLWPR